MRQKSGNGFWNVAKHIHAHTIPSASCIFALFLSAGALSQPPNTHLKTINE